MQYAYLLFGLLVVYLKYNIVETKYTYKGKHYVIFQQTKMKVTGVWVECVIYQALYNNPECEYWVRTKKEFFELFSEIA